MDSILLDNAPFDLDISSLLKRLHASNSRGDAEKIGRLADEARAIARPKGFCRIAYIDQKADDSVVVDGIKLTSRVLRVNLAEVHRVFPFIATCGVELDAWSNSIDGLLERFWADTIKLMALEAAAKALEARMLHLYQPGLTATMNPGSLEDWPISEQQHLFALLGDPRETVGVGLTDSFLMIPTKSISGIWFPTEVRFESCQLCPREGCPGRRAPYDKELYEQRYAQR
jgi:hypothetical protein